jgi:FKBP-type peptidyl-prolyl cis-trans isomerase
MIKIRRIIRIMMSMLVVLQLVSCKPGTPDTSKINPQTRMDSISYIIGLDYGQGIREQEIKVNQLMLYKGFVDGLNNNKNLFSEATQTRLIEEFQKEVDKKEKERFDINLKKNKLAGAKFLSENKSNPGVTVLPDGLQYKIIKIGQGDFPKPTDSVTIHYRAMYTDRTTFDMSYDKGPVGVRLNHLVKGLSEGIQLMKPGAIFEFYISPDLAYGDKNYMELIPGGSTVIYSVELIRIEQ